MVKTTQEIAQRIRTEIAHQGSNILHLSETTGISRTTLNRRLADESGFTLQELAKISAALRLNPSELINLHYTQQDMAA